jgi:putative SOS response-associated peptidase YedK
MADEKQPFAIARAAGLREGRESPDGETLRTFTIVTTEANADTAQLHN